LILSYFKSISEHGIAKSFVIGRNLIIRKVLWKSLDKHFVTIAGVRREMLGARLLAESNRRVLNGFFQGMKLGKLTWGARDAGPMILGTYEYEVQSTIMNSPSNYKILIDIGAADGFYAIGCLLNQRFEKAICFESNPKSRLAIKENAKENAVEDRISILGTADKEFANFLINELSFKSSEMIFLVDIEGSEFEILTAEIFDSLVDSMFIIEIHEIVENFEYKFQELIKNASIFFDIETIDSSNRPLFYNSTMNSWADEDRQVIFSEGRRYLMKWLVLVPKKFQAKI